MLQNFRIICIFFTVTQLNCNSCYYFFDFKRLGNIVISTIYQYVNFIVKTILCSYYNNRYVTAFPYVLQNVLPFYSRQHKVKKNKIVLINLKQEPCFSTRKCLVASVIIFIQCLFKQIIYVIIIFNYKNMCHINPPINIPYRNFL